MAFFEKRIDLISDENQIVLVDAYLDFTVAVEAQVSEFPIERGQTPGATIVDSVIAKPIRFTITGYKANFNLQDTALRGTNLGRPYTYSPTGTSTVWDEIIRATFEGHIFVVKTPTREYMNIIIEKADTGMNKNTGETLRFVLTMREVIFGEVSANEALRESTEGSPTIGSSDSVSSIVSELTQQPNIFPVTDQNSFLLQGSGLPDSGAT